MITLRPYSPEDHPMLLTWWEAHGWMGLPPQFIPKVGAVAMDGDTPVCAAFLLMDNSVPISMVEFLVSNPKASPLLAYRAITATVGYLKEVSREQGYYLTMTACKQKSLVRLYEQCGYSKTDEGLTHLIQILSPPAQE